MGIGPELPPHLQNRHAAADSSDSEKEQETDDTEVADAYAPDLPPELLAERQKARQASSSAAVVVGPQRPSSSPTIVGPQRPPPVGNDHKEKSKQPERKVIGVAMPPGYGPSTTRDDSESESDDDVVGPVLPKNFDREELLKQSKIQEFEERAERMRRKLAGEPESTSSSVSVEGQKSSSRARDDWMMTPPESNILGDPLKITARQFQKREHKPQDSSMWTETPADREKRMREENLGDFSSSSKKSKKTSTTTTKGGESKVYQSLADQEKEEQVRKYNAAKRSEALMASHSASYLSSEAWKANDKEHDNPSARAFDREKDVLGGRRIDSKKRDELVKQASELSSKFARGKSSAFL